MSFAFLRGLFLYKRRFLSGREAKLHLHINSFSSFDSPFERTLTLHKDSTGHLGFQFKEGKITAIAVDSSAARNGLLIDHNLLEVRSIA